MKTIFGCDDGNGFLEFSSWFTKHVEETLAPYGRFQPGNLALDDLAPIIRDTYLNCVRARFEETPFRPSEWKKNVDLLLEKTNAAVEGFFLKPGAKIAAYPDFLSSGSEVLTMLEKTAGKESSKN